MGQLDESVAEATEQRKEENEDFTTLMAQDTAAKEILKFAKNRLNKFYNPKMYVAPPKEEPVLAAISAHVQDTAAPPPAPEAPGAYSKKSEESNGVIAMLDLLVEDLDKEQLMKDSAAKRADDSKTVSEKGGVKADTEAALQAHKGEKASTSKELAATFETIQALHNECDWLLQYFDV